MNSAPPIVIEAARNERKRLAGAREELDAKIEELDAFLREHGVLLGSSRGPKEDPTSLAGRIKAMARKLIVPGVHVPSRQIYEALVAEGVQFPEGGKGPVERVSRVVWGMGLFAGDKNRGWSLKDNPNGGHSVKEATGGLELVVRR